MNKPTIPIAVGVGPDAVASVLPHADAVVGAVQQAATAAVEALGIPAVPRVELGADDPNGHPFSLTINGYRCRPAEDALSLSLHSARRTLPRPDTTTTSVVAWLRKGANEEEVARLVAQWCHLVLDSQPAILLAQPQADAYAHALADLREARGRRATPPGDPTSLRLLRRLLSLRISLADVTAVAGVTTDGGGTDYSATFEQLVESLRPRSLDLCFHPDLYRRITCAVDASDNLLPLLREGLFAELGVRLPDFTFTEDAALAPDCFQFRVNHLLTAPWPALPLGTLLVNDTVERLAADDMPGDLEPTVNPATGQPGAVAPVEAKERLDATGRTTWADAEFVVLVLAAVVRTHASCFLSIDTTEEQLQSMRWWWPVLTEALTSLVPANTLTAVLRELVEGGMSLSNLKHVFERLVEIETGDHRPHAAEAIRKSLRGSTTHRLSGGTNTVVCYLLSNDLEARLLEASASWEPSLAPVDAVVDGFLEAYAAELDYLPPTAQRPVILTSDAARSAVADALRHAYPRTVVVSHGDLHPRANVQPVARIS